MRYLGVPFVLAVITLFTLFLGGSITFVFSFVSLIANLIMIILCFLVVHYINKEEVKLFIYWVLISLIPSMLVILLFKVNGEYSLLPWDLMLWDLIVPLTVLGSQSLFLISKKWIKKSL